MGINLKSFFSSNQKVDSRHYYYIYDLVKNIIAPGDRAFMSPTIQKIIDEVLDKKLPNNWRTDSKFINSITDSFLRKKFKTYDKKYFPEFYSAYYIPNNFYKIQLMFLELFKLGEIDLKQKNIRLLDIGSATGTTALAIFDLYSIITNVLQLFGYDDVDLPKIEIDSIELSKKNIETFKEIRNLLPNNKRIAINDPIELDVLSNDFKNFPLKKYGLIYASNILNEFSNEKIAYEFINDLIHKIKKDTILILIEPATLWETKSLKRIQYNLTKINKIDILAPCGKINKFNESCNNCYSFRNESLQIPPTMKLFHDNINEADNNEKLKWSYSILKKAVLSKNNNESKYLTLNKISNSKLKQLISIRCEIVSKQLFNKNEKGFYYLKICDQTEKQNNSILKIPEYYLLPNYKFGDIFIFNDLKVSKANRELASKFKIEYILEVLSEKTTVRNETEIVEPIGNIKFENIKEENLLFFLNRFFGFDRFNDGQFKILSKILKNEDVLGILATGGGKSLTFQLPALLKPGVSLVISPLKSLMDDQVYNLKNRFGFDFVDTIHSGIKITEKRKVLERFRKGYLKILYISPERLMQKSFQKELTNLIKKGINVNYFPIDEAHCISEYGHDFRPAYARLKEHQKDLTHPDGTIPPIIALTATASANIRKDVLEQLDLDEKKNLLHEIKDRKELSFEVIKLQYNIDNENYSITYRDDSKTVNNFVTHTFDKEEKRPEILLYTLKNILPLRFDRFAIEKDPGLIFTIYADPEPPKTENNNFPEKEERMMEGARWVARYLRNNGIIAKPWFSKPGYRKNHDKIKKKKFFDEWEKMKYKTQMDFVSNKINILATTKGFGMGIDKPNIRYVIHYGFPGSMEAYFQQIGRAGRDRKHAHAILMYDAPTLKCETSLNKQFSNKEIPIPECFIIDEKTTKLKYESCPYNRQIKCDYAKQIFFIENGYPTVKELNSAVEYLVEKLKQSKNDKWVYLKKDFLKDGIAYKLEYHQFQSKLINESLIIETLYTLKIIEDYSATYLKVNVSRNRTWKEILDSTNNEIIHEHMGYFKKVYGEAFIVSPAPNHSITFDISEYIIALRNKHNIEILIDEVVQFFNLIDEREDVNVSFNYMNDFGYEIKLTENKNIKNALKSGEIKKVTDWKISQYEMLKNLMDYCNLQPFDNENNNGICRRANILTVFGTQSADMSGNIKCDFCDNCGFNNDWEIQANDIAAEIGEQEYIKKIRTSFYKVSQDKIFLPSNYNDIVSDVEGLINNKYFNTVETVANAWNEQIGENDNPYSNFLLSLIAYYDNNQEAFYSRFRVFVEAYKKNTKFISNIIILIHNKFGVEIYEVYLNYFYPKVEKDYYIALNIFDSTQDKLFAETENKIFKFFAKTRLTQINKTLEKLKEIHWHE